MIHLRECRANSEAIINNLLSTNDAPSLNSRVIRAPDKDGYGVPRSRRPGLTSFRITFSRILMGVPFPVATIQVRHARDPERAVRAAELKLIRRNGLGDWHDRADRFEIEHVSSEDASC